MQPSDDSILVVWAVLALACIIGVALAIRAEGRWFASQDKKRPWLTLRLCTIPIVISTGGLVVLIAVLGGNTRALYAALFAVAPVVYFGQHWIAGRWLKPPLSGGESAWIGFSGLLA